MKTIKGLMIKDLLQLKSYKKTLIIFILFFIFIAMTNSDILSFVQIITMMLTLVFGMVGIATFSYDQMANADKYILTLPLSKKEIVKSKYIFTICSSFIGAILGVIISLIILVIKKQNFDIGDVLSTTLGGVLGIGIVEAIQIPCIYKWGAEKGRIQIYVIAFAIAFIAGAVAYIGEKLNINLPINNILDILNKLNKLLPYIVLATIAIVYYISYKISYKIYLKKEV